MWSIIRSRKRSQSSDGIISEKRVSSSCTATASWRSSSQTITYLFAKYW